MTTVNKIIQEYNQVLEERSQDISHQVLFNKLVIMKEEIKEIVRGIQLAKAGVINTNLLQRDEVRSAITELTSLPYFNEIEAMEYAEPIIVGKNSTILYVISIPKTGKEEYNHISIRPTIKNSKQVYLEYQELFANQEELWGIKEKCRSLRDITICKNNQIKKLEDSHCISQLLKGRNATCDFRFYGEEVIESLNENIILLLNFQGQVKSNNTTKQLKGNFVVHYANETIEINNITFTNTEVRSIHVLPPILQGNVTEKQTKLDLKYLHHLHLKNVGKLQKLQNNQELTTITSTTTIVIIMILIIIIIQRTRTRQKTNITPAVASFPESQSVQPIKLSF